MITSKWPIVLLTVLASFLSYFSNAQIQVQVFDVDTRETIPFAKVFPNTGQPQFTDVEGKVTIAATVASFKVAYVGYIDTTITVIENQNSYLVELSPISKSIDEIVVLPGENPALRIINLAAQNRKANHPLGKDAFTYESYSKFIFDLDSNSIKKIKQFPILADSLATLNDRAATLDDSTEMMQTAAKFIERQMLFMMESTTERRFIPPARDQEEIKAYRVSGLSNAMLSTFAQSLQSFHFYDIQFNFLGKEYFNPIALGGTKRYFFLLEDTTYIGNDTLFTISFRPRPEYIKEGLKGKLYINTNGYAIQRVIAQPAKTNDEMLTLKLVQEYEFIDNKKWFPTHLRTMIEMKVAEISFGGSSGHLEGNGVTKIRNIQINPANMNKRGFNNIALSTDPNAGHVSEEKWNSLRQDTLNEREKNTYLVLDSLSKAHNIDRKANALLALVDGKIPMGYVNLPLDRIINFNLHEGYRLGAALETSQRLMRNITVGGYFTYGTRDKDWKYGGYSTFHLNKRLGMNIQLRYQQDVGLRGGTEFSRNQWDISSQIFYAGFYQKFMDRERIAEIKYTIAPLGNLTMNLSANYHRVEFTRNYRFTNEEGMEFSQVESAEAAFELKYNMRQRSVLIGDRLVSKPTNFPKFTFKIAKSWRGVANSNMDYVRARLKINEDVTGLRWGSLNMQLDGSITFGDVPMYYEQYIVGTRLNWGVTAINALETAYPGEFYHDKQATFIVRYSFPSIKTKAKWFHPVFALHHGIGFGEMSNKQAHNMFFRTMDRGLYEGGLIVHSIVKMSFIDIGLGLFYRYGYYSDTDFSKNLVPKISMRINNIF